MLSKILKRLGIKGGDRDLVLMQLAERVLALQDRVAKLEADSQAAMVRKPSFMNRLVRKSA